MTVRPFTPKQKTKALADDMREFKTELEGILTNALTGAPEERVGYGNAEKFGRVQFERRSVTGSTFQLRLFNSKPVIEETLAKFKRLPVNVTPLNTPRGKRLDIDEIDVALDIYGDAHTASVKLQYQLDLAAELELDEKQTRDLAYMIEELKARAAVTNIPKQQRTAFVTALIKKADEERAEREKLDRKLKASKAAESHADMPELKRLIEEHKARNKTLGIANETDRLQCNYAGLIHDVPSPLNFDPAYSTGWVSGRSANNTKHNGKIRALQQRIAVPMFCWDHKAKRVDLSRYYERDYISEESAV